MKKLNRKQVRRLVAEAGKKDGMLTEPTATEYTSSEGDLDEADGDPDAEADIKDAFTRLEDAAVDLEMIGEDLDDPRVIDAAETVMDAVSAARSKIFRRLGRRRRTRGAG